MIQKSESTVFPLGICCLSFYNYFVCLVIFILVFTYLNRKEPVTLRYASSNFVFPFHKSTLLLILRLILNNLVLNNLVWRFIH